MHRNWQNYELEYKRKRSRSLYALLSMGVGLTFAILSINHPAAHNTSPPVIQESYTQIRLPNHKYKKMIKDRSNGPTKRIPSQK